MKVIYKVIKEWSSLSGVHYNDINSADIHHKASAKVSEEWCCEKVSDGPLSIYLANSHQGHKKMKAFHNKGWGYLSLMEEIFPKCWATGGMAHHGTAGAPPGAPPSAALGAAGNNSTSNVPSSNTIHHPSTLNQCLPATIVSGAPLTISWSESAGTKCSHSMIFPDNSASRITSPSHLFSSLQHHSTASSTHVSKCSQTSATSQAATMGVKGQDPNLLIMVNQVNSTIHALHDTIMKGFKDKLTVVSEAIKALYSISGFMEKPSKIPELGMVDRKSVV